MTLLYMDYVPSITVCTVGGIVYLVSLFSIKRRKRSYTAVVEPMSQQLQTAAINEIRQYRWYPPLYLAINLIPLATRIVGEADNGANVFPLWVVQVLFRVFKEVS